MTQNKCVVCGRYITWRFSLCRLCEREYGKRVKDWPEWVRFLVNQSRRERRKNKKINKHEVSVSDLGKNPDTGYVELFDHRRFPTKKVKFTSVVSDTTEYDSDFY